MTLVLCSLDSLGVTNEMLLFDRSASGCASARR